MLRAVRGEGWGHRRHCNPYQFGADGDGVPDECDNCPGYDDAEPCPIPAVSDWGLIITSLLLLAGGTIVIARRRATGETGIH